MNRPIHPPRATYRLQLNRDFTFRDAAGIADYLATIGISHVYLSPILMARPGSTHGYDIIDHDRVNPELGGEEEFDHLVATLRRHGLGILLDIVPNHMGIGPDNRRWMNVLENGEHSPDASFFDIDWHPPRGDLAGKVLLPVLDDSLENILAAGRIALTFDRASGRIMVCCDGRPYPLTPASHADIIAAIGPDTSLDAMLARLSRPDRLAPLLDRQCWRLADWRTGTVDINYRRFFAINDLIGLCVEKDEVFAASHRTVLRLLGENKIDGLRIDHIDGLYDPKAYLQRLHDAIEALNRPAYILVEKILGTGETLPRDWPVAGTTGYDRLGTIDRLFTAPGTQRSLLTLYRVFTHDETPFEAILRESKRRFLETEYRAEIKSLSIKVQQLSQQYPPPIADLSAIERALCSLIVALPVYRTYVDRSGAGAEDRRIIGGAIEAAILDDSLASFLRDVLTLDLAEQAGALRDRVLAVAARLQQLSGPTMAKGTEDTAFYRHFPLAALDEVGGAPDDWARTSGLFHRLNQQKLATYPDEMIAGSTHDTKRGEDARTRLLCLGALSEQWGEHVDRWHRQHDGLRRMTAGGSTPSAKDEYYFYQTLLGAWPTTLAAEDRQALSAFAERVAASTLKAAREAKEHTSWTDPDSAYESGLGHFVRALLCDTRTAPFRHDMIDLIERIGFIGALTSLSATLLRLTTPGVPDIYQGSEHWNFAMVDPDNRHPVDFAAARRRLDELRRLNAIGPIGGGSLLRRWRDGLIKTHLIDRTLAVRRRLPELFARGAYEPLIASGVGAGQIIAFVRRKDEQTAIVVAPRFWPMLHRYDGGHWGDTRLELSAGSYVNALTDETFDTGDRLELRRLLQGFPVALLLDVSRL